MKKWILIIGLIGLVVAVLSFGDAQFSKKSLRKIYAKPSAEWPQPNIDAGIDWVELGLLPPSPIMSQLDSLADEINLGKVLFFDARLSESKKISCASCHQPELNWTDGQAKSLGHEGALNKRNAPTIQNSWYYKKLFWDGRSNNLEDQAFAPINSQSEMHGDMRELPKTLNKIAGYKDLFTKSFGKLKC